MKKEEFLAISLPFGLKVLRSDNITILEIVGIIGGSIVFHEDSGDIFADKFKCKPILHPLSDLTKPIEHNGEKFVLIEKILGLCKKDGDASSPWNYKLLINDNYLIRVELVRSQQTIELNFRDLSLKHAMILIEWHFDIAGLIEKGEAIDVNTLTENPYK